MIERIKAWSAVIALCTILIGLVWIMANLRVLERIENNERRLERLQALLEQHDKDHPSRFIWETLNRHLDQHERAREGTEGAGVSTGGE